MLDTTYCALPTTAVAQIGKSLASINCGQAAGHGSGMLTSSHRSCNKRIMVLAALEHAAHDASVLPCFSIHFHVRTRYNSPIIQGDQMGWNRPLEAARCKARRECGGTSTLVSHTARHVNPCLGFATGLCGGVFRTICAILFRSFPHPNYPMWPSAEWHPERECGARVIRSTQDWASAGYSRGGDCFSAMIQNRLRQVLVNVRPVAVGSGRGLRQSSGFQK